MLPKTTLTPAEYRLKVAYHIDPLLAATVDVQQPDGRARINREIDTVSFHQERRWALKQAVWH